MGIGKNKYSQVSASVLTISGLTYQLYYRKGGDSMSKDKFSVDELLALKNKNPDENFVYFYMVLPVRMN